MVDIEIHIHIHIDIEVHIHCSQIEVDHSANSDVFYFVMKMSSLKETIFTTSQRSLSLRNWIRSPKEIMFIFHSSVLT